MCNIFTKVQINGLLRKYDKFYHCVVYFFITHCVGERSRQIDNGGIVLEKNFCVALEDQYVKSEVYKPNCKSVYQLNLQKRICAMQMNLGKRIIITIFINNGNDVVTKRTFLPDFQA